MVSHQFNIARLPQLEEQLSLTYENLHEYEQEIKLAAGADQRIALRLRIKREILPELERLEREYAALLDDTVSIDTLSESEAETALNSLIPAVTKFNDNLPATVSNDEILIQIKKLQDLITDSGKTAAAKLKIALPLLPTLVSYEFELDTENALTNAWRGLKKLFRSKLSANPK